MILSTQRICLVDILVDEPLTQLPCCYTNVNATELPGGKPANQTTTVLEAMVF